jgi:hypothetical protein
MSVSGARSGAWARRTERKQANARAYTHSTNAYVRTHAPAGRADGAGVERGEPRQPVRHGAGQLVARNVERDEGVGTDARERGAQRLEAAGELVARRVEPAQRGRGGERRGQRALLRFLGSGSFGKASARGVSVAI